MLQLPRTSRGAPKRALFAAVVAIGLWLPAVPAVAQVPQDSQTLPEQRAEPQSRRQLAFSFDGKPSFRVGTQVRLDIRVKSQADWRDFPDEASGTPQDVFDLNRARVGFEGRVSKYVEYQVEREMRGTTRPWRDVFVDIRPRRGLRMQLGRFKIPFSLDQTTGSMDGSFVYRSLAGTYLAPSRDVGVMAHGAMFENGLRYEAGVFREGGDNARVTEQIAPVSQRTIAGRIVSRPWNRSRRFPSLRNLAVGAAFTAGRVPEGLNGLVAETIAGDRLGYPVYVNGLRRRLGAELQWRPGSASIQGEIIRVSNERRDQGIDNEDLPPVVQRGWYVSGTWLITGEDKKDNIDPARPLLQGGFGAVEIAGRVEALNFDSGPTSDVPLPGPRARRTLESRAAAWTTGLNWYVNRFVKVQANVSRERRTDGMVFPDPAPAWSRTLRVQFQL
jgi:phosphate-selective porin